MFSRPFFILHDNDLHFLGIDKQNIAFHPLRSEKPLTIIGESSAFNNYKNKPKIAKYSLLR